MRYELNSYTMNENEIRKKLLETGVYSLLEKNNRTSNGSHPEYTVYTFKDTDLPLQLLENSQSNGDNASNSQPSTSAMPEMPTPETNNVFNDEGNMESSDGRDSKKIKYNLRKYAPRNLPK